MSVQLYDFNEAEKIAKDVMRTLSLAQEAFARVLSMRLTTQLRVVCEASFVAIEQMPYGEFITSLKIPTFMLELSLPPLAGSVAVELSLGLGLATIDRLLGGTGAALADSTRRLPTEIELMVMERVGQEVGQALRESLTHVVDIQPSLRAKETNPQLIHIAAPGDLTVLARFRVQIGEVAGAMTVCMPIALFEPVKDKLLSAQWIISQNRSGTQTVQFTALLADVLLGMEACLGNHQLSLRQVFALREGDVLRLHGERQELIKVVVKGKTKFYGRFGVVRDRRAVKITRVQTE